MKEIEVCELPVSSLKTGFGNPRKIQSKKKKELKKSLDIFGNFGVVLIDEENNIIAGNQRVAVMKEENPDQIVLCKRLKGYSEAELRAINIKDNTHAGEWDLDLLADWTGDLTTDLGLEGIQKEVDERKIKEMELIHYEKYDYVVIACRYETDYLDLLRKLGLEDAKVPIAKKRKIKARAIWYDQMPCDLVPKKEGGAADEQ